MQQIYDRPQNVYWISAALSVFLAFVAYLLNLAIGWHTLLNFWTYTTIGAISFLAFILFYDKRAWRNPWVQWLLGVPDFSGRWEGWYYNTARKVWQETVHEIKQDGVFVKSANAWSGGIDPGTNEPRSNLSQGVAACIVTTGSGPELHYSYSTRPTSTQGDPGGTHVGVHILRMSRFEGFDFLVGEYMNNRDNSYQSPPRPPGSTGHIIVMRVDKPLIGGVSFVEGNWAMGRPDKDLSPGEATWAALKQGAIERHEARLARARPEPV